MNEFYRKAPQSLEWLMDYLTHALAKCLSEGMDGAVPSIPYNALDRNAEKDLESKDNLSVRPQSLTPVLFIEILEYYFRSKTPKRIL